MEGYNARVANRTSKSQSKSRSGATKLEVAIAAIIKALAVFKGEVVESKDQLLSAFRGPEQGNGLDGCGNENGEVEVFQQSGLPELIAGHGAGNSCSIKKDVVQWPVLPELNSVRTRCKEGCGGV